MAILVYGDIMLDQYIDGSVQRISPEAPVPIVHVQKVYNAIGGCGNVSNNIHALQVPQHLVCYFANDEYGKILKKTLGNKKINFTQLSNGQPTIAKVRIVSNQHQLLRYDIEQIKALTKSQENKVKQTLESKKYKIAVISDYAKGACSTFVCQHIINNFITLVDPKSSDWTKYSGAFLISPNLKELSEAVGTNVLNNDEEITAAAKKLIVQYNVKNILVTRSAKGMSLVMPNKTLHIATAAKDVYDVTGAGDTVIATIAAMLYNGKPLMDAVKMANKAAAIAVSHFGTYAVTKNDLALK
jgi:D-beta-D-heptose 7-phosphate kinase / D-beta-D-heptose 1-phosphate adenosyltransferase